jgi:integrase/recombinase XerC/integrase/recombinase XerD
MSGPEKEQLLFVLRRSDLEQDVAEFLVDRQARGLAKKTIQYYSDELRHLTRFLAHRNVESLQSLSTNHLRQYLLHLAERGRNEGGIHCAFRVCKTFLRWAWLEYDLDIPNPITRVNPPRIRREALPPLPLTDFKLMLDTCQRRTFIGDRDRGMLTTLLDTGCRASEFLALNLSDVDISSGAVIVKQGKGRKFRTVFLGARSRRDLLRYFRHRPNLEPSSPVWVTGASTRLTYWGLRQVIRRRAVKAGVVTPSLHSFRRAFALLSLRNGMDVYSLQKLMGHSDLSILRRYLAQTQEDLQRAHQKSGPVDNML